MPGLAWPWCAPSPPASRAIPSRSSCLKARPSAGLSWPTTCAASTGDGAGPNPWGRPPQTSWKPSPNASRRSSVPRIGHDEVWGRPHRAGIRWVVGQGGPRGRLRGRPGGQGPGPGGEGVEAKCRSMRRTSRASRQIRPAPGRSHLSALASAPAPSTKPSASSRWRASAKGPCTEIPLPCSFRSGRSSARWTPRRKPGG